VLAGDDLRVAEDAAAVGDQGADVKSLETEHGAVVGRRTVWVRPNPSTLTTPSKGFVAVAVAVNVHPHVNAHAHVHFRDTP
jgi:hypothetical protein